MGRAEELFHSIQTGGITAIEQFIIERRSEELFLDFKRSADDGNLKNLHVNDLNNYGRAISGFSNSSGGVIVWGIDCSDLGDGSDVARAQRPIEDPKRFVSWLEKKTSGRTLPAHSEVIHHAIEIQGLNKGFVVTLIPKSDWAPHQEINSKCYLMRVGSNFEPIPHGILEGFFGRRIQSKIVHKFLVKGVKYKRHDNIEIQLGISLRNEGRGLAKFAFLNADIIACPTEANITLQQPSPEYWISHLTEGRCTGVPKIRNAMESNGSPPPIFKTDEHLNFFLVTLPIHPEASRKITVLDEKSPPIEDKTHQFDSKTHQLIEETHQLEPKTHQLEVITKEENLPLELKLKLDKLKKRPKKEELKSMVYALCTWKPLTAQQIAELLDRKDKKHLVRQYLTPLVKDRLLKYVYPERGNSPNQAYIAIKE